MTKPASWAAALLSLAACAGALVLPEPVSQSPLSAFGDGRPTESLAEFRAAFDGSLADHAHAAIDSLADEVEAARGRIKEEVAKVVAFGSGDGLNIATEHPPHPHPPHHPGDAANLTIYELISRSQYTTKFAKIVNEYPSIVELLSCTSESYTLFVPTDEAFDEVPDDHEKLPKEFVEALLKYHVGVGHYPVKRILNTYTIPSALEEKYLGDEAQRLKVSFGLTGVKINLYSKVVATDIMASNGVIHGINHLLVPPPMVGTILNYFPQYFSTLLLAYEKTDFVNFVHSIKTEGTTLFAPSNSAFAWLGPKANAFLFNTRHGRKYLKAILKYHIVPNVTLYTDAVYDKRGEGEGEAQLGYESEHFELPTLLCDAHVGVDVAQVFGFRVVKINGFVRVTLPNAVAKNGVIHIIDKVLIPPHKHKSATDDMDMMGDMDVEDLKARLEPYLE